jgi:hypothetical protein
MNNPVIPGHANGSSECAPDDRLRMNRNLEIPGSLASPAPRNDGVEKAAHPRGFFVRKIICLRR